MAAWKVAAPQTWFQKRPYLSDLNHNALVRVVLNDHTMYSCMCVGVIASGWLFSAFTGFETNNKYEIKNSMGQRVYFAAEGMT